MYSQLSADGRRVLAVAYRWLDARDSYSRDDESHLVLAGFISFADPILDDVSDVLEELRRDGVSVKILTGDNPIVARHVCRSIGLDEEQVVTGDDIEGLDDGALGHVAEQGAIFARVSPAQKNRIILALKRRGHVVGFMGDGINDAPSLHAADVGISVMGAADVAREAADVILGERSLRVLHRGILAGRRASGNMMKYLLMGTSSNFGNVFSMAAASVFLPFLPMLPTQILLNNFLYDVAQITIPTDNVDESYLRLPQRWNMRVIRDFMLFIGPISSLFDFLTFYVLLRVFHAGEAMFHSGWFVESLATQTLVLFVIRTMGNPLRSRPSRALTITTLAITGIGVALPWTPLAGALGFTPLPWRTSCSCWRPQRPISRWSKWRSGDLSDSDRRTRNITAAQTARTLTRFHLEIRCPSCAVSQMAQEGGRRPSRQAAYSRKVQNRAVSHALQRQNGHSRWGAHGSSPDRRGGRPAELDRDTGGSTVIGRDVPNHAIGGVVKTVDTTRLVITRVGKKPAR